MEKINGVEILIKALGYPDLARPEFLILNQKESGWSKGVFLRWLQEATFGLNINLTKPVTFDIETGLISNQGAAGQKIVEITEQVILELRWAIELAYKVDTVKPTYTSLELLAFLSRALNYIHDEFQIQAGLTNPGFFYGETTANTDKQVAILYNYQVVSNIDLLNFVKYQNAIRNLLLNVRNLDEFRRILKPILDACFKIIELFNKKIQPLAEPIGENEGNKGKSITLTRNVSFDEQTFGFSLLTDIPYNELRLLYAANYTNRNFAEFAFKVALLVSNEVLNNKEEVPTVNDPNWDISTHLLYHYHIAKTKGEDLSESQIKSISTNRNLTHVKVRGKFRELSENKFTFKDHTNSKTQFRKDYELILPELKNKFPAAYRNVSIELDLLINSHNTPKK